MKKSTLLLSTAKGWAIISSITTAFETSISCELKKNASISYLIGGLSFLSNKNKTAMKKKNNTSNEGINE